MRIKTNLFFYKGKLKKKFRVWVKILILKKIYNLNKNNEMGVNKCEEEGYYHTLLNIIS